MAKRKYKKKKKLALNWFYIVSASLLMSFCILVTMNEKIGLNIPFLPSWQELNEMVASYGSDSPPKVHMTAEGDLQVHILDVGQADSILIIAPDKTVLIDAGENDMGDDIYKYLTAQGVKKIDILIGSHPHSDHIGGMDYIINSIPVDKIIMPKIPDEIVPTTRTYTDVLTAVLENKLQVTPATPGKTYDLGGGAVLTLLAPRAEYGDLNNMSVVSRLDFGDASFMFTGDSSKEAEQDILRSGLDLDVDVLSVAHHGSNSSSTQAYLEALSPKLSTISVGADNSYGHPHKDVMKRLEPFGTVYRTDVLGTIILTTDGTEIKVLSEKNPEANQTIDAAA